MSIAQISPSSVLADPSQINPTSQTSQQAATAQAIQTAQGAIAKSKSDTVTLSSQALKMNSRADKLREDSREGGDGKPAPRARGKG